MVSLFERHWYCVTSILVNVGYTGRFLEMPSKAGYKEVLNVTPFSFKGLIGCLLISFTSVINRWGRWVFGLLKTQDPNLNKWSEYKKRSSDYTNKFVA